ncbi:hypothetical protein NECAME_11568 [Necator americanus]|uniref:Survival of motor neuron-related-splicing factor 30 n=1 Tax=Necator americanus TaxID=51031 RepID=W2T4T0_NECAM|nr:hypothetical protein NECAME_11568 [Necator americanus]ETN76589.1 hypothetical protein NECAME_11568 [Necator americanus]
MADEELASYRLQFQQVEAALLGDPDNEELQKLKADLEEVIALQSSFFTYCSGFFTYCFGNFPSKCSGQKTIVDPSDLTDAPDSHKKNYVFDSGRTGLSKTASNKKEWLAERERRRMRAQKKEMKRKELDLAKESEKSNWLKFNNKAVTKGIKGMKRVIATGSAQDGPAGGMKSQTLVSSRANQFAFKSARGSMDSLF